MKSPILLTLTVFFLSAAALAGWDMENAVPSTLKSIRESVGAFVGRNGSCNSVDLTANLKTFLNNAADKIDLDSAAADPKNIVVLELTDNEKACLATAVTALYADRLSKNAVPVRLLNVVNVGFALKLEQPKNSEQK